jgi:hypothetical protein
MHAEATPARYLTPLELDLIRAGWVRSQLLASAS